MGTNQSVAHVFVGASTTRAGRLYLDEGIRIVVDGTLCTWGDFVAQNAETPEIVERVLSSLLSCGEHNENPGGSAAFYVRLAEIVVRRRASRSPAFVQGVVDATSEVRCDAWSRELATRWLANTTRNTAEGELGDYARGYDATIQAVADGTFSVV